MGLEVHRTKMWVLNCLVMFFLTLSSDLNNGQQTLNVPGDLNHYQSSTSPQFFLKIRPKLTQGGKLMVMHFQHSGQAGFVIPSNLEEGCWECVYPICLLPFPPQRENQVFCLQTFYSQLFLFLNKGFNYSLSFFER